MLKKISLAVLLLGLILSTSFTQAKVSYTWAKVGDEFEVWELNDTFIVENVEKFNQRIIGNSDRRGDLFNSWEEIEANLKPLGLRESMVKKWTNRTLVDIKGQLIHAQVKYGNNKELSLKILRDGEKIKITNEENTKTPLIFGSEQNNYFIFLDDEGIWGIKPVANGKDINFTVTKLTKDKINGKSRAEIQAIIKSLHEDGILFWINNPMLSPNGNYVAYFSNKDCLTKEPPICMSSVWIVNTQKGSEFSLFNTQKELIIYGWVDDHTLAYALNDTYFLYDANVNSIKPFLKGITLLSFDKNAFVYTKKGDDRQIYLFMRKTATEVVLPRLPDKAKLNITFLKERYLLSPDTSKILVIAVVRDPKRRETVYLIDITNESVVENGLSEEETPFALDKWIGSKDTLIRSYRSDYGINTLILSLDY